MWIFNKIACIFIIHMKTNINITYNHLLWADSLHSLIEQDESYHVSHMICSHKLHKLNTRKLSITIVEATYPNAELVEIVTQLKKLSTPVVVVGYHMDNEFLELLISKGLDAYVLKTCSKQNLFEALRNVKEGKKYFCAPITESLSKRLNHQGDNNKLTIREKEVLLGLVSLCSNQTIASKLNISVATVRTHRKNIMHKFGTKNYLGLLRYACRNGLLDSPDEQFCVGCCNNKCQNQQNG